MQVCYPTLPAQYFHLLRRQMHREFRKPLILMMPKSLLRNEQASSSVKDFTDGGFRPVIGGGEDSDPLETRRLVFCSGKIYFSLEAERKRANIRGVSAARIEQLYPFPQKEVSAVLSRHANVKEVVWVQEEPKNMGAWNFVEDILADLLPRGVMLRYAGRKEAASPAAGLFRSHQKEEADILSRAFGDIEKVRATAARGGAREDNGERL